MEKSLEVSLCDLKMLHKKQCSQHQKEKIDELGGDNKMIRVTSNPSLLSLTQTLLENASPYDFDLPFNLLENFSPQQFTQSNISEQAPKRQKTEQPKKKSNIRLRPKKY